MVNVGSFLPSGVSSLVPKSSSIVEIGQMALWVGIFAIILIFSVKWIRDRIKYQYFGVILKRRQSLDENIPESKVVFGKAGYFTKKGGKNVFRIKYGAMPWQQVELSKLPDPQYMIDRLVFYEMLNKDNLIQAELKVNWEGRLDLSPVEDDLKYGAELDILEKEKVLDTKKMTPLVVGMIVLGLIIMAGIIVFYFLSKA